MSGNISVGTRLKVSKKDGSPIGFGTFLWDQDILLDGGTKIRLGECSIEVVPPSEVPPFEVTLTSNTRLFFGEDVLSRTVYSLEGGQKIEIVQVKVCSWNHGSYVAGKIILDSKTCWILMSELQLPYV